MQFSSFFIFFLCFLLPVSESENVDEEAKFHPGTDLSPTHQPHSPLTQSSPNMAPKDTSGEHKKDVCSDQVNGETATDFKESDSAGKTNDSDLSSEDQHPSTIPEQKASETKPDRQDSKLSLGETHTSEDNQQQGGLTVSADKQEADNTSQQPQSSTPTKPDNGRTHTLQGSADTDESSKCEDKTVDKNEVQYASQEENPGQLKP